MSEAKHTPGQIVEATKPCGGWEEARIVKPASTAAGLWWVRIKRHGKQVVRYEDELRAIVNGSKR